MNQNPLEANVDKHSFGLCLVIRQRQHTSIVDSGNKIINKNNTVGMYQSIVLNMKLHMTKANALSILVSLKYHSQSSTFHFTLQHKFVTLAVTSILNGPSHISNLQSVKSYIPLTTSSSPYTQLTKFTIFLMMFLLQTSLSQLLIFSSIDFSPSHASPSPQLITSTTYCYQRAFFK